MAGYLPNGHAAGKSRVSWQNRFPLHRGSARHRTTCRGDVALSLRTRTTPRSNESPRSQNHVRKEFLTTRLKGVTADDLSSPPLGADS